MTTIYLNAMGITCALGQGASAVRQAMFSNVASGVSKTAFYTPNRSMALGRVHTPLPSVAHFPLELRSRNNALMLASVDALRSPVQAAIARFGPHRVAVILGVSTAGLEEGQNAVQARLEQNQWPANFVYAQMEMSHPAHCLARELGVCGPVHAISTACSSAAKAMASGARLLRAGLVDAVVSGGVDALCRFTIEGFSALASVSSERCLPLSANRSGINLGEGSALFLMTRDEGPVRLAGWGETSDAHHMSAPDPTGRGAMAAMAQSLHRAGLPAQAVDYVNLHGTATPQNDAMECLAVSQILGLSVPVSSTKPYTGHTLAAAGAIEAALSWLTLVDNPQGQLPPHCWDGVVDSALPPVRVVRHGETLGRAVRTVLSNSFAFGGSNATLLLAT
jgi:3-oxoacyl-[acyl-carrier-protein] synthase I